MNTTPPEGQMTLAYSDGPAGCVVCVACPRPTDPIPLTVNDIEQQGRCATCNRYVIDVAQGYAPAATPRPIPCNWARTRWPHTPHTWEPQPGMDPVPCPGFTTEQP